MIGKLILNWLLQKKLALTLLRFTRKILLIMSDSQDFCCRSNLSRVKYQKFMMDCTASNAPQKDAQLLYTMEFASCSCPQSGCYAIINSGQEHDFFGQDVMRNAPSNFE